MDLCYYVIVILLLFDEVEVFRGFDVVVVAVGMM
jgi:hypothetical protein